MDQQLKNFLFVLGRPLSPLYSSLMKARAYLYRKHLFKQHRLSVPVVSVGNLTMGGTGKTPLVICLARTLKNHGYSPAVISRGYQGASKAAVNIVSDGERIKMSAEEAGDEPVLMANRLPSVVVLTGKKRYIPAAHAIEKYQSNLVVLDDGFQHLALSRDLDLVLFDIDHFAGNSRVFPGGELREPVSALNRCDAFILTGRTADNTDRAIKVEQILLDRFPDKRVFTVSREFSAFHRYDFNETVIQKTEIEQSQMSSSLCAFSGIANPQRFYRMLDTYGFDVATTRDFGDHHAYSPDDVAAICSQAATKDCSALITTEKDIVKFDVSHTFSLPVFVPVLDYSFDDDFIAFITECVKQKANVSR